MILSQPDKICKKCGNRIPANGQVDREGKWVGRPKLICEVCAIRASPPGPGKPKKKWTPPEEQPSFDVPAIKID